MLWEVDFLVRFSFGERRVSFVTFVEKNNEDFELMGSTERDIAIQQGLHKYFLAGYALYPGATLEVLRVESIDSEAI